MTPTLKQLPICFALIALTGAANASAPRTDGYTVVTTDLEPFTNTAQIPANVNVSSIKFERARIRKLATRRTAISHGSYCQSLSEPGGSMYCAAIHDGSFTLAYELTYSFEAQPLASDETGDSSFTFSVFLRPDELSPSVRKAIALGKVKRENVEKLFLVKAQRDDEQVRVVGGQQSTFCDANQMDGLWMQTDSQCHDKVAYQTITRPASYLTVRVEPLQQSTTVAANVPAR